MSINRRLLFWVITPITLVFAAAFLQWGLYGLPYIAPQSGLTPTILMAPHGFPLWLRITHYVNFLFLILLIRSGLQILVDHPRLYGNVHCTPGTEWLRFTPVILDPKKIWTSKQDSRYLTPWIGLPGKKHTVGMARHWHFLSALFWIVNGLIYVILLLVSNHWMRLVPTTWAIIPQAWSCFVYYGTFHMPPEPNGFYAYNALQQLAYFGVVFVLAPLAILTGPSMSPALTSRFGWYPRLPLNRQIGRSLHFLVMCAFVVFIVIHVALVIATGFARNMNHIVLGTDTTNPLGLYIGLVAIAIVIGLNGYANYVAWKYPRNVQHFSKAVITPIMAKLLDAPAPQAEFLREDISPFFWPNGIMPTTPEWRRLKDNNFSDYKLNITGLVENPIELTLAELRSLEHKSQITLHHCVQGWSGIAEWGGVPLNIILDMVRPLPTARYIVFYSYGEGLEGGQFYDSLPLYTARHPQTILAYNMNSNPLPDLHGAPLRLRVENQLGFKMVKWISKIELVEDVSTINLGEGGYNEDHEYFGALADI